ncbi:MAG: ABC transporter permease [Methanomassiliicoccales archaeon]|nr:ABC transporter permease [Methanomassiliicoccales archaeon]
MKLKHVLVDLRGQAKAFYRVKSNLFWTLAFPLFLILVFGAIFSNIGSSTITLYVQDLDNGPGSDQFLGALDQTGAFKLQFIDPGADLDQYIKDNSLTYVMVLPANLSEAFAPDSTATVSVDLRLDETVSTSSIVRNIVSSVINNFNLGLSGGREFLTLDVGSIVQKRFTFLDFFVPGVIGLTVMTTCIFSMQGTISRFRAAGIFRKLATTPMTPLEWLMGRMIWYLFISLVTLTVVMVFGILVFGMSMTLNPAALLLVIFGSAMFSALGMIIARFVKNEETASAATNAITFPMMFLSGTFFPLEDMPGYLQSIASVLPLTYLSQGLRDAMVYDNLDGAYMNLLVVVAIAIVFVVAAVLVTKWEED